MRELRTLGAGGFLTVDHQAKLQAGQTYDEKTPFGSVYKENLARVVWQARLIESVAGQATVLLRNRKHNLGPKAPDMALKLTFVEDADGTLDQVGISEVDLANAGLTSKPNMERRIADAFQRMGQATIDAIAEALGEQRDSVKAKVALLQQRGVVMDGITSCFTGRLEAASRAWSENERCGYPNLEA